MRAQCVPFAALLPGLGRLVLDGVHDRLTRGDGLCDQAEHFGFNVCPVRVGCLGDGDEVRAVEYRGDAIDV